MDKALLKKAAIQSLALMIAVITFSYALKQYQAVTIAASDKTIEVNTPSQDNVLDLKSETEASQTELSIVQKLMSEADPNILKKLGDNYLVIKKPQGDNINLKLEDLYINKSIQLTITGITANGLKSDMISRIRGEEVYTGDPKYTETTSLVTDDDDGTSKEVITRDYGNDLCHGITLTEALNETTQLYTAKILIELNTVYAYITYEDAENYYIDLRKPSEVYDKILVIDAGHGGKDGGALSRNKDYFEKNINLAILLDLKKLLDKENIKVYYTRTGDDTVFLRPRSALANAVDCDYFISIHCNANDVSSPNGTEVLYYNNKFKGVKNSDLANVFSDEVGKSIPLQKRGIIEKHPEDIFIMDQATVPMILIEVGYLTNYNDMYYLSKYEDREAVAKGIYNGIMRAYKEYPVKK